MLDIGVAKPGSDYDGIKQQAFGWIERDLERVLRRNPNYEHDPDIVIKEDWG